MFAIQKLISYLLVIVVFTISFLVVGGWLDLTDKNIEETSQGYLDELEGLQGQVEYDVDMGSTTSLKMYSDMTKLIDDLNLAFKGEGSEVCRIHVDLRDNYGERVKNEQNKFSLSNLGGILSGLFQDSVQNNFQKPLEGINKVVILRDRNAYLKNNPTKMNDVSQDLLATLNNDDIGFYYFDVKKPDGELIQLEAWNSLSLFVERQFNIEEIKVKQKYFLKKYFFRVGDILFMLYGDTSNTGVKWSDYDSLYEKVSDCSLTVEDKRVQSANAYLTEKLVKPLEKSFSGSKNNCEALEMEKQIPYENKVSVSRDGTNFVLRYNNQVLKDSDSEHIILEGVKRIIVIDDSQNDLGGLANIQQYYDEIKVLPLKNNMITQVGRKIEEGWLSSTIDGKNSILSEQSEITLYDQYVYSLDIGSVGFSNSWNRAYKFDSDLVFINSITKHTSASLAWPESCS